MKHLLRTLLVLALVGPAALSAQTIVGSKHDLSVSGANGGFFTAAALGGQTCVYCHTPHLAQANTKGPLWNRNNSAAVYTMYTSSTIKEPMTAQPGAQSLSCLTCHDGTVAVWSTFNTVQGTATALQVNAGYTGGLVKATGLMGGVNKLGSDLTTSHPVGIDFNNALDAGLQPIASVNASAVKLFGIKVECASCHAVHDRTNVPFLRRNNLSSALCTTCHLK